MSEDEKNEYLMEQSLSKSDEETHVLVDDFDTNHYQRFNYNELSSNLKHDEITHKEVSDYTKGISQN